MLGKAVLKELIKSDIIWAFGAAMFLYLYLSLHMSSFILAFFSLLLILFSFGITQAVYVWVLGIDYFQALHLMSMFLVLGIAADDIFVFHDAWVQSAKLFAPYERHERMAYTIRRAYRQMVITSCTTSVAFLANYFSDLIPVCTFGVYAAIIVQVNFLLAITYFPAVEMMLEKRNIIQ